MSDALGSSETSVPSIRSLRERSMLVCSVRVSYEPPVDDPFVHFRSLRDYRVRKWFQSRTALLLAQNDPSVGPMLNTKIIPLLFLEFPVSIPWVWSTISGFHMQVSKSAFYQCQAETCLTGLSFSPKLSHQNFNTPGEMSQHVCLKVFGLQCFPSR